jgi:glycosyltransferase involved in cell wall biosynthesis
VTRLHLIGAEAHGGAAQATRLVMGEDTASLACRPTILQSAIRTTFGFCDPLAVRELRRRIRESGADVVHLHRFSDWGTAAIVAARKEGRRTVWHPYDYWGLCPRQNFYHPDHTCDGSCLQCYKPEWPLLAKLPLLGRRRRIVRHLNTLDEIHALSRHSQELLRQYGVTVPMITVVPLKVEVPPLREQRLSDRVLFCGWKAGNKGWNLIPQIMSLVQADWKILGMGKDGGGVISRDEVLREIARARVLVVPEQWNNPGPIVIQEALALGTTVVASDIGAISEIPGVILCPYDSPQAFASAIRGALCTAPC